MYQICIFNCMAQINLILTPEFEKDLMRYMKLKGFSQKSEAIREALHEAVEKAKSQKQGHNFKRWRAMALKAPLNSKPKFKTHDDLWN